jgi:hypothetical protein
MNKLGWLIMMFLLCRVCEGQNLVPNGDFEGYAVCPTNEAQLYKIFSWFNPSTNILGQTGTPDYFNQCDTTNYVSVPLNFDGYQQAHSGGGYCGIVVWHRFGINFREYLEVHFTPALVTNTCYHFEMYCNLGDVSDYTTHDIGVYFSDTAVTGINNYLPLPFNPQINNIIGNVFDTLNWTLVNGNYTAQGGENVLIIGNFKNNLSTDTIALNSNPFPYPLIYLLIDDVSLSVCTGINKNDENTEANIFPNPVIDKLNITNRTNEVSEIILYDIASRKLLQEKFTNSTSINSEQLAEGIYLYEVRNKNGVIKKGKIVKD